MAKQIQILSNANTVKLWQEQYDELMLWLSINHLEVSKEYLG